MCSPATCHVPSAPNPPPPSCYSSFYNILLRALSPRSWQGSSSKCTSTSTSSCFLLPVINRGAHHGPPPPPTPHTANSSLTTEPVLSDGQGKNGEAAAAALAPGAGGGNAAALLLPVPRPLRHRRAARGGRDREPGHGRGRRRGPAQRQRQRGVLRPVRRRPGHLVRRAQRRRPLRQRRRLRVQEREPVPVHGHDLLRQPAALQGRQGLRRMLQDQVHEAQGLLRADGDGGDHGHELLPGGAVPLRPERHRLRQARQARPQRRAPTRRDHRHLIHQGSVRVPWSEGGFPRGGGFERGVHGDPGGVRERRRRRGAGGPEGVRQEERRAVDADAGVVGIHLAPRLQPQAAGALLRPHPQRVGEDPRRPRRHPQELAAQHLLPLHRPVQLEHGRSSICSDLAGVWRWFLCRILNFCICVLLLRLLGGK